MIKILYFEQLSDVIARNCSIWYHTENAEYVEIPYSHVLSLTIKELLNMIDRNNLYYKKD